MNPGPSSTKEEHNQASSESEARPDESVHSVHGEESESETYRNRVDADGVESENHHDDPPLIEDDPAILEAVGGGTTDAPILDLGSLPLPKEYSHGNGNELTYSFTFKEAANPGEAPQRQKRPVYHSLVVYPDDTTALCMDIECDQTEKYCTLSVLPSDADIGKQSFAEYFAGGATLKPFYSSIVRICVCPLHNKMVMASLIMDAVKSTIPLPSLATTSSSSSTAAARNGSVTASSDPNDVVAVAAAAADASFVATPVVQDNRSAPPMSSATPPTAAAASPAQQQRRGWKVIAENGDGFIRFFHVERTTECYCDFPVLFTT
ncbi:Hypothetical protein, putative [Bodo saltans]|uniref:Uncharacterized protein n=1 Tax=Bodo saltans TaxID=75058 RepID=A0A0S4IHL2_BODSA|nr:Hypothetical protein, putative [Bodo saltans]|eukprot:CUE66375.1 Hypothetical protein, putative [Bodo saltans]